MATKPQIEVEPPPASVTHVYAKNHKARGLQPHWIGPFKINSRPSGSTLEIRVGRNKDNSDRLELRAWSDCKPAYLKDGAVEAERPKRGRPAKTPVQSPNLITDDLDTQPFHGFASSIDFSKPPPPFPIRQSNTTQTELKMWSASPSEIASINQSISKL